VTVYVTNRIGTPNQQRRMKEAFVDTGGGGTHEREYETAREGDDGGATGKMAYSTALTEKIEILEERDAVLEEGRPRAALVAKRRHSL